MIRYNPTRQWIKLTGLFLMPVSLQAQGLIISSGAQVIAGGTSVHMVLQDCGIRNEGMINAQNNNTFHFRGNAPTGLSLLGGNGTTQLYNLGIEKSSNDIRLTGKVTVAGTIDFNGGRLDLNGQTLDLGATGYLNNEGGASYISGLSGGAVIRKAVMNAPSSFNPGNIGLEITSAANMGQVTISRKFQSFPVSPSDNSIRRYYEVEAEHRNGLNAGVKCYYHHEDLPVAANEDNLYLWVSPDKGKVWHFKGKNGNNTLQKYVQQNSMDILDWVTLSTPNHPLPLHLLSFKALLNKGKGLLKWELSGNGEVARFEVQRAPDGRSFSGIGKVESINGDKERQAYSFTDHALLRGFNYYRLKLVSKDGAFTYSPVEVLNADLNDGLLHLYPNPAEDIIHVTLTTDDAGENILGIYDISGKQVLQKAVLLQKGVNHIVLPLHGLGAGAYILKLNNLSTGGLKFIKT